MEFKKLEVNFQDDRGIIKDILVKQEIDSVTVITSKAGAVRANHYHKDTIQWTYVMEGKVQYLYRAEGQKTKEVILNKGEMVKSDVMEAHSLKALEDSSLLILTRGPRGGEDYESDTFRLEKPLALEQ